MRTSGKCRASRAGAPAGVPAGQEALLVLERFPAVAAPRTMAANHRVVVPGR